MENFVRALKAPSDPPQPGGPYKIETARSVWDDTSFYVPSKGEVIVEWILTRLLKDRTKSPETNSVLDSRFWELLGDVVSPTNSPSSSVNTRPIKTWLVPLLSRIPIAPIAISFLNLISLLDSVSRQQLAQSVCRSLLILWPLGVPKLGSDTLSDCFSAVLGIFKECESNERLAHVGLFMTSSFRTSLANASNKKKLFISFMQGQLRLWMECGSTQSSSSGVYRTLLDNIYCTGIEVMFSLEILRQHQDSKSDNPLFEALVKNIGISPPQVASVLPRIFNSFFQCIKTFRGALFSQSSGQSSGGSEEVRSAGMDFFASCCLILDHIDDIDQIWKTRVALLSVVDAENLYNPRRVDMDQLLRQNGELATETLSSAWKDYSSETRKLAIDVLSILTRIDHDLVVSAIPRILQNILLVHWPLQSPSHDNRSESELNQSALEFLDLLLDYHVKTRTVHIYIQNIFTALGSRPIFPEEPQSLYQVGSSGPLLNSRHLDRLGKCVHGFLMPGQTVETVRKVLDCLKDHWEQFGGTNDEEYSECPRKRRKVEAKPSDVEFLAVSFSLCARVASVVLWSLPVRSALDTVRRDLQTSVDEAQTAFIRASLSQTIKAIHKSDRRNVWASQIVAAAILHFRYALDASRHLHLENPHPKSLTTVLDMLDDDEILPELRLEMFRILLTQSAQGLLANPKIFLDGLLDYLDRNFSTEAITWGGVPHQLESGGRGNKETALTLFHLIVDRWMPAIDGFASGQHLERLGRLLLSIAPEEDLSSSTDALRPSACFVHVLHSAEFWELPNMRNALLSALNNTTSILDQVDAPHARTCDMQQMIQQAISAYDTLLFFPIEYLSRTSRTDFVRRALTADVVVSNVPVGEGSLESYCRSLTVLRTFVKRVFAYLGAVDLPVQTVHKFLEHILNTVDSLTTELLLVTLDLIEILYVPLLKSAEKSNSQAMLELMNNFTPKSPVRGQVKHKALTRLVSLLVKSFSPSDFPEGVRAAMAKLQERLLLAVLPQMVALTAEQMDHGTLNQIDPPTLWCHVLSFERWLQLSKAATPKFGTRLIIKIMSTPYPLDSAMCAAALAILLEELNTCSELDRSLHLELIVAGYISLSRIIKSNSPVKFDAHISKMCRLISVSNFSYILDFVSEELAHTNHISEDLACLTHFSALMLHEAPQGTLQLVQNFITRSLNLFSGHHIFSVGPLSLRLQVLDFVGKHCSDRPAALRSVDLTSIWTLLSKLLTKSQDHDEKTSTSIFHAIVNIANALIRLRRDLVVLTLPHLGMILRQLIMSIRGARPQLGAKQSKLVADSLPRWVNISQPLTSDEGKILARLLVTLTTKTIVRSHSSHVQKAESLGKPLSKHAAYVLKAYVEAMNDPLCIVGFELRRELEPGLFALCSMLSEHSRDAMMVSLDAGGKTTLKTLWREYEKQRYVGKG